MLLNLLFFDSLTLSHLFQLLLHFYTVLSSSYDPSLCNLLAILVIEDHSHGMLEVLKLLWVNVLYLAVLDLIIFNQRKENICGQSLHLQIQLLCNLALLETLINPPNMLSECGVIIVFDAVIRSITNCKLIDKFQLNNNSYLILK